MIQTYSKQMINVIHPLLSVPALNCEETSSYDNDRAVTKSSSTIVKEEESIRKKRKRSAISIVSKIFPSSTFGYSNDDDDNVTTHQHYPAVTKKKRRKMLSQQEVIVPKKFKKRQIVRFVNTTAGTNAVSTVVHSQDYSIEDIKNSWYNKIEYQTFWDDINSTAKFFSSLKCYNNPNTNLSLPILDHHHDYCSRGLEAWYCPKTNFLKLQSTKVMVNSIIQRQTKLNNGNRSSCVLIILKSDDKEEILRKTSLVVSRRSCEMAIELAVMDAIQLEK